MRCKKLTLSLLLVLSTATLIFGCNKTQKKTTIKPSEEKKIKSEIEEQSKSKEEGKVKSLAEKKALFIIAYRDFRDEEYEVPRKILEGKGIQVKVASSCLGTCRGRLGLSVEPDMTINQVNANDYDIIAFIGGPGASEYFNDPTAHKIAQEAVKNGKVLGAICIAPATLANAGVLDGKRATVFSSEIGTLNAKGAIYTGKSVEIDGKIITANGPEAATKFGEALVEVAK